MSLAACRRDGGSRSEGDGAPRPNLRRRGALAVAVPRILCCTDPSCAACFCAAVPQWEQPEGGIVFHRASVATGPGGAPYVPSAAAAATAAAPASQPVRTWLFLFGSDRLVRGMDQAADAAMLPSPVSYSPPAHAQEAQPAAAAAPAVSVAAAVAAPVAGAGAAVAVEAFVPAAADPAIAAALAALPGVPAVPAVPQDAGAAVRS
jgi:hypothetical protein